MRSAEVLLLSCLHLFISFSSAEVCLCDTSFACDILCCCDSDCSAEDKARFSCGTIVAAATQADVTCVSGSIFSRISPDSSFSFLRVNDDNCFTPTAKSASSSSTKSVRAESSFIEPQSTSVPVTYTSSFRGITSKNETILKANDVLYARDGLISRPLTLPAGWRGQCVKDSVLFLRNSSSTCSLKLTKDVCKSGSKIDSLVYSTIKIVKNFRKSANETVSVSTTCVYTTGSTSDPCQSPKPRTDASGDICDNVVTKIDLVVIYGKEYSSPDINHRNISLGIESAALKLTLNSIPMKDSSVSQLMTTVSFEGNSKDYPNVGPRYQRYKPGYELLFNVNDARKPYSPFENDKDCTKFRLTFPKSSILNCVKKIGDFTTTNFTALTKDMFDSLPSGLAKYYNSDLANSNEWVQISWDIPKLINSSAVPMNLVLSITRRSYGNKLNPENEILSATTSISYTNIEYLNREGLVKDKLVFYFTLRFMSVDVDSSKDNNIISKLSRSLSYYFSYQKDGVPLQLFAIAVAIFVLLTLVILVFDQGKPKF